MGHFNIKKAYMYLHAKPVFVLGQVLIEYPFLDEDYVNIRKKIRIKYASSIFTSFFVRKILSISFY